MRIAFLGGTRFIGHAAARHAVRAGHAVSVLHRGVHRCEVDGAHVVTVDRADASALAGALRALRPDVLVDTRAMTRVDAETTLAALEGLAATRVVLSSQDVYAQFGRLNDLPAPAPEAVVTEHSPLTVPYPFRGIAEHAGGDDYDKKDVEAAFAAAGGATILRLPAVYGARDPARRFGIVVDALDAGTLRLPRTDGSFRWTHAHVDDVAHAILLAAEAGLTGQHIFNVGERSTPTTTERAEAIAGHLGVAIEWYAPAELDDAWGHFGPMANDMVVSSDRLRAELGFAEVLDDAQRVANLVAGLRGSRAGGT